MRARRSLAALAVVLVAGCAAGPDYVRPAVDTPTAWKVEAPWREARPSDALPKGEWWKAFGDPELDALEARALAHNPTLALASARWAQARASLSIASASLFPQLSLFNRDTRARGTENRPLSNYNSPNFSTVQNDFVLSLTTSYELDLAGRVRRSVEGAQATAERSAADFENVRLLLTADLAVAYFGLRQVDAELDVLARAIAIQRRALELVTARHDLGAASGIDVAQQQALIDNTLTQVELLRRQRSQLQNAIATLTGTPAPVFEMAPRSRALVAPPVFPVGVPSDILERRPDVAAAERAMAAANAQIGVARAALYPSIVIAGFYGAESRDLSTLFDAPSLVWSIGASLVQPIFDGGRIQGNIAFTEAGYEAELAIYRRVVLNAMQEVQDGITGLSALERAHGQATAATVSAARVLDMANTRYEGGAATYLEVITAQQFLLNTERLATQLQGQRLAASAALAKSLGGGWERN
ncbi:Outer membrane protein OprM [Usitatibacter rugosus]|uniref:Outer membrane protein OprM n=1 Tax=Usitatibacter rugosus TaxID=2732067 RepID=A0A6M4GWS8_9PROT|nr:efflux transporter outer membrane subunit [Usitatibacter rugosus]QJR10813.1 Outer membrane protein OprM [Usitatibacter rugosus]